MDDLAGQDGLELAPADGPATGTLDIEKIKQEAIAAATASVNAAFEERIKGFQRLVGERDDEIRRLSREIELSALDEEEREAAIARNRDEEFARLQAENELLKLGPEFTEELPFFQRLLAAPDARTQLQLLRELRTPVAAPANEPASDNDPDPVDLNNPASGLPVGGVYGAMTEEMAERVLRSTSRLR